MTELRIKWTVCPEPTGRYRSFETRGWPTATCRDTEKLLATMTCADEYVPAKVRAGDHSEIAAHVYDYSGDGKPKRRTLKRRAATLDSAKEAVALFYDRNPAFLEQGE